MVILKSQNKIPDFLMILALASPFKQLLTFAVMCYGRETQLQVGENLTLSSLDLPLSSSSTTSRELLSQFSTCSG